MLRFFILTSFILIAHLSFSKKPKQRFMKKETIITGLAEHTKSGAVIITDTNDLFYIENKSNWEGLYKKRLKVKGILKEQTVIEDVKDNNGLYRQGHKKGAILKILTQATWEEVIN